MYVCMYVSVTGCFTRPPAPDMRLWERLQHAVPALVLPCFTRLAQDFLPNWSPPVGGGLSWAGGIHQGFEQLLCRAGVQPRHRFRPCVAMLWPAVA